MSNILEPGQSMAMGQSLFSPNKDYQFTLQEDNNICLYQVGNDNALWCAGTNGSGIETLLMQQGQLLGLDSGGDVKWMTTPPISPAPQAFLEVDDNGTVNIIQIVTTVYWTQPS